MQAAERFDTRYIATRSLSALSMKQYPAILSTAAMLFFCIWIAGIRWYGGVIALPTLACYAGAGQLRIVVDRPWSIRPTSIEWRRFGQHDLGFNWWFSGYANTYRGITRTSIDIPMWFPVVLLGAAAWNSAAKRSNQHLHGVCKHCSYDLRGVEHSTCPECGKVSRLSGSADSRG